MKVKSSRINWKHLQRELDPMKPTVKTLTLIQNPSDYCAFMRLMYASGYTIHHSCEHPRSITLSMGVLGYIEKRDPEAKCYKFVIYGKTKRNHNNARIVYLSKGE